MKLIKTKLFAIVALLLWAGIAQAVCNLSGYPVRVVSVPGKTKLFFRTTPTANHYFVAVATDPFIAGTVNEAYKGKSKVFVQTSIGSCPTPVPGSNWIGNITVITLGA